MKKLTAGIFTALIGLCAANSADAAIASKAWVEQDFAKLSDFNTLSTTVGNNKTAAENSIKAVADDLAAYKTTQDTRDDGQDNSIAGLGTLVGELPSDAGVTNVVAYIDKKTTGIATDTALTELQGDVAKNAGDIAVIKGTGDGSFAKAIADSITALDLANTYDAKGAAAAAQTAAVSESKSYTDSRISNDPVEGDAVSSVAPTVSYTQGLIDLALTDLVTQSGANKTAIEAINNETTGILAQAKADAAAKVKELADGTVATNAAAIEAINKADTGILAQAKADATAKADKALEDANKYTDAEITELSGTLSGTAGDLTALTTRVGTAEGKITTLEGTVGDSTKGLVKAAAENAAAAAAAAQAASNNAKLIQANAEAIAAEEERATKAEGDLDTAIKAEASRAAAAEGVNAAAAKAADDKAAAAQTAADTALAVTDLIKKGVKGEAGTYVLTADVAENGTVSGYQWELIQRVN